MNAIKNFFVSLWVDFYDCFIDAKYYKMYLEGLWNTILIALGACAIGIFIGIVVTAIRIAPKNHPALKILDKIAKLYVTVIRGTPVVLQLFICYFVLLIDIRNISKGLLLAAITFGINSGAYMSEILRGGIEAVDYGQTEAGRSLGLNWMTTFFKIVLPQAIKNAIPTMFNEFITLIKETSVAGYVGIIDLTKIQSYITTQTMKIYMPLFIIAAIYLILVLALQQAQKVIERSLNKSHARQ
ncbi:MAG: amino acid ABC transporter permease [Clostridia bacterium]|nr:amino acid ABC transporter permease [Clostridia bacterium]